MIPFLIFILVIVILYLIIKKKINSFLLKYFHTTDLNKVIEETELEAETTPKSVFGMGNVYNEVIKKDFPDVNLNELKGMVEKVILDAFKAIEEKDTTNLTYKNTKVNSFIESKINDYKDNTVKYDNIHFHKTVLSRYNKENGVATMIFQISLEYYFKIDNKRSKKIQDRYKVELIYIIDTSKVSDDITALGLNCPNCGAPVTTLGNKICRYCGSEIKELTPRVWSVNNIEKF